MKSYNGFITGAITSSKTPVIWKNEPDIALLFLWTLQVREFTEVHLKLEFLKVFADTH